MQRRRFGRTGLEVPALTFGGGWVGGLLIRGSEQERERVLDRALHAGIDWIDTAALYGNGVSETVIGGWLRGVAKEKRPRISTKFNIDTSAGDFAGQIEHSVSASLQRLGLPRSPSHPAQPCGGGDQQGAGQAKLDRAGGPGVRRHRRHHGQLRAQGLCDWIGLTGLAIHCVAPSDRQRPLRCGADLLQSAQSDGHGRRRAGWNSTDFDGLLHRCAAQDMGVMGIRIFAAGHLATNDATAARLPSRRMPRTQRRRRAPRPPWTCSAHSTERAPSRVAIWPRLPAALHYRGRDRRAGISKKP